MLKFRFIKESIDEDKGLDKVKYNAHKASHKDFESVCIGTLIHQAITLKLNYNTQQPVLMPDGKLYLIDIYFPGINLAVECDEEHHLHQVDEDEVRQNDIISLTAADFIRINAHDTVNKFREDLDSAILEMQKRKAEYNGTPVIDYDYENEETAIQYLKKYLISNNISAKFENDPICNGRYADAVCIEHGHFPIDYINIALYRASYTVIIKYNNSIKNELESNLNIFDGINNIINYRLGKNPNTIRFNINPKYFYINIDKSIDLAIEAALEIKKRIINFTTTLGIKPLKTTMPIIKNKTILNVNKNEKLDILKNYLLNNNISAKFENDPLKIGKYGDSISIEYDHFPIEYLDIVAYTNYIITLKYDEQYDEQIKTNLNIFDDINYLVNIKYAKNPFILRFYIDYSNCTTVEDELDQVVNIALEIKRRLIEFIDRIDK